MRPPTNYLGEADEQTNYLLRLILTDGSDGDAGYLVGELNTFDSLVDADMTLVDHNTIIDFPDVTFEPITIPKSAALVLPDSKSSQPIQAILPG